MTVKPLENLKEGALFFEVVHTTEIVRHSSVSIFEVFAQSGVYILGVKPLENIEKEVLFFGVAPLSRISSVSTDKSKYIVLTT